MRIESGSRRQFVEIRLEQVDGAPLPSRAFAIETRLGISGEFGGRNAEVWVEQDAFERFLGAVQDVERTRRGHAEIEAMSPHLFRLELGVYDAAGHVAVRVRLRRDEWVGREHHAVGVEGGFELDPSALPVVVSELRGLAGPVEEA